MNTTQRLERLEAATRPFENGGPILRNHIAEYIAVLSTIPATLYRKLSFGYEYGGRMYILSDPRIIRNGDQATLQFDVKSTDGGKDAEESFKKPPYTKVFAEMARNITGEAKARQIKKEAARKALQEQKANTIQIETAERRKKESA